ncbi:MAG: M1 family metallopeptidase, partial [Candidatus Eisenbacteria bacterium]|nr:M1 family metallopeptidase [Candidatus Eisenbacteria bacterium]
SEMCIRDSGNASLRVASRVPALEEVVLDMFTDWLYADSVLVDGEPVPFLAEEGRIRVRLSRFLDPGDTATVRVAYWGGIVADYMGLTFGRHEGHPYLWTLSEPDYARYWWPTKDQPDDKADSADVLVTVPEALTATSNGLLREVTAGPGATRTFWWHESYPIATYLISITAGDFRLLTGSYPIPGGGTMPTEFYVFPELVERAQEDFSINNEAIDTFAERFGLYPFLREKYGITVFGYSGGMEHQTNTSYGHWLISGQHYFDWIYVHELAHQWWGDDVTCATWGDVWLNEGFASWSEVLWAEHAGGPDSARTWLLDAQQVLDRTGRIYGVDEPFGQDANLVYNKASWVVHMLRGVLGDPLFFAGLAEYRARHTGSVATTEQFEEAMEAASGQELDWFMDQWIHGPSWPTYEVSALAEAIPGGQRAWVHLEQTQRIGGFFTMPVRIRARAGDAVRDTVLWNDPDHEDLALDLPEGPLEVEIDPDWWILRDSVATAPYGLNIVTTDLDSIRAGQPVS